MDQDCLGLHLIYMSERLIDLIPDLKRCQASYLFINLNLVVARIGHFFFTTAHRKCVECGEN